MARAVMIAAHMPMDEGSVNNECRCGDGYQCSGPWPSHAICETKVLACTNIPRSVISAKVRLALRCKSILSEKTKVLRARNGSPEKKSVSPRCSFISHRLFSGPCRWLAYILKVLEQICNSLTLAVGQNRFVKSTAWFPCTHQSVS